MTPSTDPYRLLGLAPGASLDEVKRAYRRLAKEAHPDSAGPAATARFIAVQRAYESIVRGGGRQPLAPRGRPGAPARPTSPWPGPRTNGRPAPGARPAGRPGAAGTRGTAAKESAAPGAGAPGGGPRATGRRSAGSSGGTDGGERPDPPRAKLGTTSYDGVEAEPGQWGGASWYGPTTGTYWTINPKEYADPRKHGPEYLARGRAARARTTGMSTAGRESGGDEDVAGPASAAGPAAASSSSTAWSSSAAAPSANGATSTAWAPPGPPPPTASVASAPSPGSTHPVALPATERGPLGPLGRFGPALVGWPPIGLALAALLGWATGCSRFAASCPTPLEGAPLAAQLAILALLVAVPRLAAAAALGTLALLVAAVPAAVMLSAAGGFQRPSAATALLLGLLVAAWLAGVILRATGRVDLPPLLGGGRDGPAGGGAGR